MAFSLNDKHVVIHYHYIEDPNKNNAGMNPCSIAEFTKHVKFLSEHYKPASLEEIFEASRSGAEERYYSITFDDGLKDQYQNAIPVLRKHNGKATFFIITQTLEGVLPSAHKLHVILSQLSIFEVIDMWNVFLKERYPEQALTFFIPKDRRIVKDRRLYADIPTANVKETFTTVSLNIRDEFLNFVFAAHGLKENKFVHDLFLNESEIEEIERGGWGIGVHTHAHEPIHVLGEKNLRDDFKKSKAWIRKILKRDPVLFSYPYGFVPEWGAFAIEKEGITHAVTVEERGINSRDHSLLIPRYDMATLRNFLT